jgi:purine-nucleoside phosphorylase
MARGANQISNLIGRCAERMRDSLGKDLPKFALVLGSGFHEVLSEFKIEAVVPFSALPSFPTLGVAGHSGRLLIVTIEGMRFLVCAGRAHFYEGHTIESVVFPVRVLAECGVSEVLFTNAAGGINRACRPGDFMLVRDHINMTGVNPLRGLPVQDGQCFVDLSDAYCAKLRGELKSSARRERVRLHEGVYIGVSGPSYETPAEIKAFRKWGADAVGMSTVPEVIVARYCGLKVAALSCITNYAAGMRAGKLSHQEVLRAGRENASNAARVICRFARGRSVRARTS